MLFRHEMNADQFDLLSYGNLRGLEANSQHSSFTEMNFRGTISNSSVADLGKENMYGNSEESSFGNGFKDDPSVSAENSSFSWFPGEECQSDTLDHDKRPLSDVKPCQFACKRPKQTDQDAWYCSFEDRCFSGDDVISDSALADESIDTRQLNHNSANSGAVSDNPCLNHKQSVGLECLYLPDWVSFPGYFEDCKLAAKYNQVDETHSPVHGYLPRKGVSIGPEYQADIPEWRPQMSASVSGASGFCSDLDYSSVSTSESVSRGDNCESEKWIRYCVIPMLSCSSPVDWAGDNKIDCDCTDEGSFRCSRQHIIEARENLKMSLGPDKFHELGLSDMGEDVSQRWTDEDEKLFQRVVFSNPVSLGKNFWDYLPHAFPSKTSKDLVSYYFNVFMLRKRGQQNRSDLRVDSDDDEFHDEPLVNEQEEGDSAVESHTHEQFINNSISIEDEHKDSEEHID